MATEAQIEKAMRLLVGLPPSERMLAAAKLLGVTLHVSGTSVICFAFVPDSELGQTTVVVANEPHAKRLQEMGDAFVHETRGEGSETCHIHGDGSQVTFDEVDRRLA